MMKKGDSIDRGRMQAPLDEWEREAEERLRRRANVESFQQTAASVAVAPNEIASEAAAHDFADSGELADVTEPPQMDSVVFNAENSAVPIAGLRTDLPNEAVSEPVQPNIPAAVTDPNQEEADESSAKEQIETEETEEHETDSETTVENDSARRGRATGLLVRTVLEWIVLALFVLLIGAATLKYPLPPALHVLTQQTVLIASEAGLFVLACLLAAPILADGLLALFSFGRNTSSAAALAFFGGVAGFAPVFLQGAGADRVMPFAISACACTSIGMLSQVLAVRARRVGEAAVENMHTPHSVFFKRLSIGSSGQNRTIVAPGNEVSAGMIREDKLPTGRLTSVLSFVVLLMAIAAACTIIFFLKRPITQGVLFFASVASLCAPLVMGLCTTLPFLSAARALRKRGAVLSGYSAVVTCGNADAVYLPERMIYPEGKIKICALRPMCEDGLENAVLMAASVATAAQAAMAPTILDMLEGGEELLRPVSRLEIIDEMGIEAWVDGQHVLLGSRSLLRQKRVNLTGRMLLEVEAKYAVKGNDFVYLVVDDVPAALFVLDYIPDKKIRAALRALTHSGVHAYIGTVDANITRDQVSEHFHLNKRMVRILPHQQADVLAPSAGHKGDISKLYIQGDAASITRALTACVRLNSTMYIVMLLQVLGVLCSAGLAAAAYFQFGWILEPLEVLAVQSVWAVPPLLFALLRRHA